MRSFFRSIFTVSIWWGMLTSRHTWRNFLEALGLFTVIGQIADWFGWFPSELRKPQYIWVILGLALIWGFRARFPVRSIRYKPPKRDYCIEVRIGDIFAASENIVVSSSSTFDTDINSGLISKQSLQGQLTERFLNGDPSEIDCQIDKVLRDIPFTSAISPGKDKRYPIGTVAPVTVGGKLYYFLAMAELNQSGNADTTPYQLDEALEGLWRGVAEKGELGDIAVPVIGSGRGRLKLSRQKIIEKIAQSFASASAQKKIAGKLAIILTEKDAEEFGVNLYEVKDYLFLGLEP